MAFSLRADVVYPVDRPPIEHGVVTIEGERIVDVAVSSPGGEVLDLGPIALVPGFVNAHTHLEFSQLRQPLGEPGMGLANWIRLVIAERGRKDVLPLPSVVRGANESLDHGVTTVCDISTTDAPIDIEGLQLITLLEVIGFSRARAASSLSNVIERLSWISREERGYSDIISRNVSFGISPHAPYTVSPDLLRQLIELAQARALPVAMHIAESREELEFLDKGTGPFQELLEERSMWDAAAVPRGSRPLDYLRMLSVAPRSLVIHGNYLDDEERAILAQHSSRMSLIYCPRTHAYFRYTKYPLLEALSAGVRVALGTDSRASNPDLDVLAEMRHVAATYLELDPDEVLRMGTLSGAEALGRSDEVGSITPEKWANLVAIPIPESAPRAASELLFEILRNDEAPSAIWMHGRKLK